MNNKNRIVSKIVRVVNVYFRIRWTIHSGICKDEQIRPFGNDECTTGTIYSSNNLYYKLYECNEEEGFQFRKCCTTSKFN